MNRRQLRAVARIRYTRNLLAPGFTFGGPRTMDKVRWKYALWRIGHMVADARQAWADNS